MSVVMDPVAPVCAFLASVTWAIGSTQYARMSKSYSASSVNFSRALVALPLFVIATFVVGGSFARGMELFGTLEARHWAWFTLSMVASYGLGDMVFLWSTQSLGISGALAIASSYPLWTSVAGVMFQGEHLSLLQGLGLVLTIGGIVTVILGAPRTVGEAQVAAAPTGLGRRWVGVSLALLTSVFWALNSFAVSRGGQDLSPTVGNAVRMLLALAISAGLGMLLGFHASRSARGPAGLPLSTIVMPPRAIAQGFWIFAIEAFAGSFFYMYGLSNSPLVIGSTLTSLAPVLSVPIAWVLRLEKVSIVRTLGVISVVIGLWLLLGIFGG